MRSLLTWGSQTLCDLSSHRQNAEGPRWPWAQGKHTPKYNTAALHAKTSPGFAHRAYVPTERHPSHSTGCPRSLIILGPAARPRVPDRRHSWLPDNNCDRHSVLVTASRDLCLPLSLSRWPLAALGEAATTEKRFIWGQRPTSQALSSHNSATHEPDRSIQRSPHPKTPGGPHSGGLEFQNFSRKVQQTWSHQAHPQGRSGAVTTKPQPSDSRLQISFVAGFIQEPEGRASLVVHWLRICLPMQGTRVRALVWEDPTCRGATGPVSHNY